MFHAIETVQNQDGKIFIKEIIFDAGYVVSERAEEINGYGGKSFSELLESEEIETFTTDAGLIPSTDALSFKRPISLDRFFLMFAPLFKNREEIEEQLTIDLEHAVHGEEVDTKNYVF